jgi:C4-dicarboxylate-specific signal transduction histidine kinase
VKANPTVGILGFCLGLMALLALAKTSHSGLSMVSFVALAAACWATEYKASRRAPSDFSCGFLFCLILAVGGEAVASVALLVSILALRHMRPGVTYPWDLAWTAPSLVLLAITQLQAPKGTSVEHEALYGASAICLTAILSVFGSLWIQKRSSEATEQNLEREQRKLRLLVLPFAFVALGLSSEALGWAALVAPLCLAVESGGKNLGFKVQALTAGLALEEAEVSRRELTRVEGRLSQVAKKQRLMEELVTVFEQALSPDEAFEELCRATRTAVEYRSIVLFRLTKAGVLEPFRHRTPEKDLQAKTYLMLKTEPLVERAWTQDSPFRGVASTDQEQRLLSNEPNLVAIPLKPFGVLYVGRGGRSEPFTKAEASKLLFIAKRAESSLVRAEETARSQAALAEQTTRTEQLEKQYALTSQLLEASQIMMTATSPDQVASALKEALTRSVPDCAGLIRLFSWDKTRVEWGLPDTFEEDFQELLQSVLESNRPLYLPDLSQTRYRSQSLRSLILVPLLTGNKCFGLLVVGSSGAEPFARDMHDYICMLARMAGGGIESLSLTVELKQAHEQVVQASKLSAIGELAAGVAHELNTPLATVGLAIESASMRPERAGTFLADAEKALEQAQSIVSGLLEHARRKDADRVLVQVSNVLEDLKKTTEPQLYEREQTLHVDTTTENPQILASPSELLQILNNLVSNASDASPEGSQIQVKVEKIDNEIVINVVDKGCGIADDIKTRIFDPFFTTKPVGKGTGLGLSVCRELVHRHRGEINFQNSAGGGSSFSLRFPARSSDKPTVLDH